MRKIRSVRTITECTIDAHFEPHRKQGALLAVMAALLFTAIGCEYIQKKDQGDPILAQLRSIPSATLSDAVDEVVGKRGFMSHDMRPVGLDGRMAGRAKTVVYGLISKHPDKKDLGLSYGLQIIDESGPGDIFVAVTGDLNFTGIGGLMTRTAKARGMEGAVIDGAARDIHEIEELGLPVFARSICPSTIVGRCTSLARDIPVKCGGVTVSPGDYIVGDRDGVVCIPAGRVEHVIERALEFEAREKKMIPRIQETKSLQKVIAEFKRI